MFDICRTARYLLAMTDQKLVAGLELQADRVIPRRQVIAWASWDWGSAAFNAVVTTFVFTVYLTTTKNFGSTDFVSTWLGWTLGIAGVLVALIAPITGQKADGAGRRKFWLAVETAIVVALTAIVAATAATTLATRASAEGGGRGWIGVAMDSGAPDGVRVTHIVKGSPAEKGGMRDGDRMVRIDGARVASPAEVQRAVAGHAVGDVLAVIEG